MSANPAYSDTQGIVVNSVTCNFTIICTEGVDNLKIPRKGGHGTGAAAPFFAGRSRAAEELQASAYAVRHGLLAAVLSMGLCPPLIPRLPTQITSNL